MESTIIEQEMLDEIAELKGIKPQIADITARAMNGEIDFIGALNERVALLAGLPENAINGLLGRITFTPARGPGQDDARHGARPCWCQAASRSSPTALPPCWASTWSVPMC